MTSVENSKELGMVIIMLASSAYNTNLAFLDIMGKSLINNEKNKGSRIDPCGTCLTSSQLD
jgi:hypothetical protein